MGFFKRNAKVFLTALVGVYLVGQSYAVQYSREKEIAASTVNENGYDKTVSYEIHQLEKNWSKIGAYNLLTVKVIADPTELTIAKSRLKEAQYAIQASKNRTKHIDGERKKFLEMAQNYYEKSASKLLDAVDFLLSKKQEYVVTSEGISFDDDKNADKFLILIENINSLQNEKQQIDEYIQKHNSQVRKTTS